jgi:hypothetical protein
MRLSIAIIAVIVVSGCTNTHLRVRYSGSQFTDAAVAVAENAGEAHARSCDKRSGDESRHFRGRTMEGAHPEMGKRKRTSFEFTQRCDD